MDTPILNRGVLEDDVVVVDVDEDEGWVAEVVEVVGC